MFREKCAILENKSVAPGHFVMRLRSPRIAKDARPGQFVQIQCSDSCDPLLGRPFSFLTASKTDFSVLYQVVGQGTKILSGLKKGEWLWVLGPLGNGFTRGGRRKAEGGREALLVGGGVGIPPLYYLAQAFLKGNNFPGKTIHVFLGARDKSFLLCERDFERLGVDLRTTTDNGSKGLRGFVTNLLEDFLNSSALRPPPSAYIYTCGPTPMLKAVSALSKKYKVPCEVSVEVPMACGFGACIGCAIKVRGSGGERFAMACVEGPVFRGSEILWD